MCYLSFSQVTANYELYKLLLFFTSLSPLTTQNSKQPLPLSWNTCLCTSQATMKEGQEVCDVSVTTERRSFKGQENLRKQSRQVLTIMFKVKV